MRPLPPQRVHVRLKRILPDVCVTWPVPPHTEHTCGWPTVPVPWQSVQVSSRATVSLRVVPRMASQNVMST